MIVSMECRHRMIHCSYVVVVAVALPLVFYFRIGILVLSVSALCFMMESSGRRSVVVLADQLRTSSNAFDQEFYRSHFESF
jgi:hypothetical protein